MFTSLHYYLVVEVREALVEGGRGILAEMVDLLAFSLAHDAFEFGVLLEVVSAGLADGEVAAGHPGHANCVGQADRALFRVLGLVYVILWLI